VAYVRFGVKNPAHYRLMFGSVLAPVKNCPPSVIGESAASAKEVLTDIVRQVLEEGIFGSGPTSAETEALNIEALNAAVLSAWSLVHGLTMLLLDGLAGVETTPGLTAFAAEKIAESVAQLLLDGIRTKNARH